MPRLLRFRTGRRIDNWATDVGPRLRDSGPSQKWAKSLYLDKSEIMKDWLNMASGTNQYFRRDRLEPKQAENQITFGKKLIRKTLHNDFFITPFSLMTV